MRIVVLHAGGIGDLVLVESLFSALREQHPDASLELVCRADVAPVAALYARPPDAVHPFGFNPYRWALPDDRAALQAQTLLQRLSGPVELFVSAELRATWLSEILAAALAPHEAVISDEREPHPSDLLLLLGRLKLERNRGVRRPEAISGEHELDRYARLAGTSARRRPALKTPRKRKGAAELAVFPLSAGRINRWPLDAMGRAALRLAGAHQAKIVLFGGEDNRAEIEAAAAAGLFGAGAQIVIGRPDDIPAVAARIAAAAAYLGIDTGLVHLAAAYGVPGVAVFGGGHWPTYAPWSPRSAAVVAPIPCFGCEWDCTFDRPFCIEAVDVDSVIGAFEEAYGDSSDAPQVRTLDPYDAREREIFGAAALVHRAAQGDRAARLTAITRLREMLGRYARRARARTRKSNVLLASLADTTVRAALRLDEARSGGPRGLGPPVADTTRSHEMRTEKA